MFKHSKIISIVALCERHLWVWEVLDVIKKCNKFDLPIWKQIHVSTSIEQVSELLMQNLMGIVALPSALYMWEHFIAPLSMTHTSMIVLEVRKDLVSPQEQNDIYMHNIDMHSLSHTHTFTHLMHVHLNVHAHMHLGICLLLHVNT